jgi:DNA polymerase III subunit alpha
VHNFLSTKQQFICYFASTAALNAVRHFGFNIKLTNVQFSHLHNHTQFSLLDGAANIPKLYEKARMDNMPAMAITDHGNMFGVFEFVAEAWKDKNTKVVGKDAKGKDIREPIVKPIVGCEFYLVQDRRRRQFSKDDKDQRYHQLMLAKNEIGYHNLVKLCSLGYIEGMYGKYPRIDKELIQQYHEGLIATTCCLAAEVPRTILKKGEAEGEKVFRWWLGLFEDDYYVELQRHEIADQVKVNNVLLKFAQKYGVPVIASNDSHYVDRADSNAHDILLCINTGSKQADMKSRDMSDDDELPVKGGRFAFPSDRFYFKTTAEMQDVFSDIPQALDNTNLIVDKIKALKLEREILLPYFSVPKEFNNDQNAYLEYLTWNGARERYKEITAEVEERLNFELGTIKIMGFAGYFLIVSDFIKAGRDLGVFIGPGRGSAAGSAVAYCIGITNIDPIKYNLLFERFLNPDRKSMPDIDTDFDDVGRQKVIDYVVEKYGRNQVAHIVTYGTMAAKSSIKDVARVLDLPLADANALAKLVPEKPGISLKRLLHADMRGEGSLEKKEELDEEALRNVTQLREFFADDSMEGEVLREAEKLEGSVRNTGIHASAIIIAPKDLTELLPVSVSKDDNLYVTQFEGNVIENAGVIKMDFLGLKNLTILKNTLEMVKRNYGREIILDELPLDDAKTFELYQRAETNGTFQFESAGMQKYLRDLKPDKLEDLIAMNALFRPGPLAYIPVFIRRKHGLEPIVYDLPEMEEFLAETYGVTVYQEQVMLLSRKLANFTKGDADTLRKAMGKKQRHVLDKMKTQFLEGGKSNNHPEDKLQKIWTDWEAFAQYAFNKSHATCYAVVAYQTAYMKAHYPAEYMAAVLNSQNNIEGIKLYMEECQRMGLKVLGPDVNESLMDFTVVKENVVRFGLNAIKGVGQSAVEEIIAEREKNGSYKSIYELVQRVSQGAVGKKTMENLVLAGALDCFAQFHRAQYFFNATNEAVNGIDKLIKFSSQYHTTGSGVANSLFGAASMPEIKPPALPDCDKWSLPELLDKEKEVIGIYLSAHPLDEHQFEMANYGITPIGQLVPAKGIVVKIAGYVTDANHLTTKTGNPFGKMTVNDYSGTQEVTFFKEDYLKYRPYLLNGQKLMLTIEYKERYMNAEKLELKVNNIMLLDDVRKKLTKKVTLQLPLEAIDETVTNFLITNIKANPGTTDLILQITDSKAQNTIRLKTQGYRTWLNDDLLQFIIEKNIEYTLEK